MPSSYIPKQQPHSLSSFQTYSALNPNPLSSSTTSSPIWPNVISSSSSTTRTTTRAAHSRSTSHSLNQSPLSGIHLRYSSPPNILMEGWLLKQSRHLGTRRMRYVRLSNYTLSNHKSWGGRATWNCSMRGAIVECGQGKREIIVRWHNNNNGGGNGKERCIRFIVPDDIVGVNGQVGKRFKQGNGRDHHGRANGTGGGAGGVGVASDANDDDDDDDGKDGMVMGLYERWIYALKKASLGRVRIDDVYEMGEKIGHGMNGIVVKGWDKTTGSLVAIKKVGRNNKNGNIDQMLEREVKIVKLIQHEHIVQVVDVFVTKHHVFFVMEFIGGGELFDFIAAHNNFDEMHAAVVMRDLLDAVRYLHAMGIVHRDIKLENLLCQSKSWPLRVKLADFGFASFTSSSKSPSLCSFVGTPYYLGPELLNKEGYGPQVDLWACGVVLYIMLSGRFPFSGNSIREYFEQVLHKQVWFPELEWGDVSGAAKDLVLKLLDKNPRTRLTAAEALNHPWMTLYNRNETRTRPSLVSTVKFKDYKDKTRKERIERIFKDSQEPDESPVRSGSTNKVWKRDPDSLLKRSSGLLNMLKLQPSNKKRYEERLRVRERAREPDVITSSFSDDGEDEDDEEDEDDSGSEVPRDVGRAEQIINGEDCRYSDAEDILVDSSRRVAKSDSGSQGRFRKKAGGKVTRTNGEFPSPPSIHPRFLVPSGQEEPSPGCSRWKVKKRDEFPSEPTTVSTRKSKSRIMEEAESRETSPKSKKMGSRIADDDHYKETSTKFNSSRCNASTYDAHSNVSAGRPPRSGLVGRFLSQRRSVEEYKMGHRTRFTPMRANEIVSNPRQSRCSLDIPSSTPSSEAHLFSQSSSHGPGKVSRHTSLFSRLLKSQGSFGSKSSASRRSSSKSAPEKSREPGAEQHRSQRRSIDILRIGRSRRGRDKDVSASGRGKRDRHGSQSRGWLFTRSKQNGFRGESGRARRQKKERSERNMSRY